MEDDENKNKNRGFDEASNAIYKKPENEIEKDNNRFIGEQRQVSTSLSFMDPLFLIIIDIIVYLCLFAGLYESV
jgi:hypothetical protein